MYFIISEPPHDRVCGFLLYRFSTGLTDAGVRMELVIHKQIAKEAEDAR
jgi:hypothetical protein